MTLKTPYRLTGLFLCLGLLLSCAAPPVPREDLPGQAGDAARAQVAGDWPRAAQLWESAAQQAGIDHGDSQRFLLNAADAWWRAGDPGRARSLAARVDGDTLPRSAQSRLALLKAELALADGQLAQAGLFLEGARRGLDVSLRPRYQRASRRLEALQSDPHGPAIGDATGLARSLEVYDTARAVKLLESLETVPSSRLAELARSRIALGPWAALALDIRRSVAARADLLAAATLWDSTHPGHAVRAEQYLELIWHWSQQFRPPGRVAVLLPAEGNLAAAGAAIRDGLVSAYLEHPGGAQLDFMPVGEDPVSTLMAYSRSGELGYDWVIGPLRRESATLIAQLDNPPVPVLLLNEPEFEPGAPVTAPHGVYSLSLSQDREARAVARKLITRDHSRVIVLTADSAWGDRIGQAFSEAFRAAHGEVVAVERFGVSPEDHASRLAALLRIEDSRQRKANLQAALRIPLEFEPSRRDDFDAVFLAVDPVLGRQLKPQLRFFDAGDKPIFAMSRIFTGQVNAAADQDLNGIVFAATRWAFKANAAPAQAPLESLRGGVFGALFALGADAWNLLSLLDLLASDPELEFAGQVGTLRMTSNGRLEREPAWARFQGGRPVPAAADPRDH